MPNKQSVGTKLDLRSLPQDIVDDIVSELDDADALKACSLAGSALRGPCQRSLLQSLTLSSRILDTPRYRAACALWKESPHEFSEAYDLFQESPHIAGYIKRLSVRIHRHATHAQLGSLGQVLGKLENVRRCFVHGQKDRDGYISWNDMGPGPLLDFLLRQNLRELHLSCIASIPSIVFLHMLTVPFLSLSAVSLMPGNEPCLPLSRPNLRDLVFHTRTEPIYRLLAGPQYITYTSSVRRFSIDPQYQHTRALILNATDTLEHIHFCCMHKESSIPAPIYLLPLPRLRVLEAYIGFPTQQITSLLMTIALILSNGSPALEEVVLTFRGVRKPASLPHVPDSHAMGELDAALVGRRSLVLIRWRLDFTCDGNLEHYTRFADIVKGLLSRAQKQGRVAVEAYQYADDFGGNWPLRRV
ncbi:hypothetical protein DFH06DRAFT_1131367 [Mycena polygramma]|nr:hypothetical protein DFH06DRAFT_1131367 [Mycena polygramma]